MDAPQHVLGDLGFAADPLTGLRGGIADTDVKAAFLKCAIEDELTPDVERVMVTVAEAHKRTGAPITVHTSAPHRSGPIA